MRIQLISVGRARGPMAEAIADYEQRIRHYFTSFEAIEVKEAPGREQNSDRVRAEEGERILARVSPQNQLVVLHRPGKRWSSEQFAAHLGELALRSAPGVTFVIGGAYGLAPEVLARSDLQLSLSTMMLPHEMAKLILTEQLYRAGTIARNEPYHKGSGR